MSGRLALVIFIIILLFMWVGKRLRSLSKICTYCSKLQKVQFFISAIVKNIENKTFDHVLYIKFKNLD